MVCIRDGGVPAITLTLKPRGSGKCNEGMRVPQPREEWVTVGVIPALFTPEQYELAQQKLARKRQFAARNNTVHDYRLRALVSCGLCGLAAPGRTAGVGYPYYVCAGKRADGVGSGDRCRSRLTPAGQLDELVWEDCARSSGSHS